MPLILVADDDVEQIGVHSKLLETLGYDVRTAASPAQTLQELEGGHPDVVIVDLRIPTAADGLSLIREIREMGYRRPIVVLCGCPDDLYGSPEEKMVSRVVMKGRVRELLRTIAELLGG